MNAHVDVLDLVSRLKVAEEPFALATVVRTVSVTAAKAGAKAVIRPDGRIEAGWIGGGCARGATLKAAREALDLASAAECGYAWGQSDAAQTWGEAYFVSREFGLARRAFERALEVRRKIEHPRVCESQDWLDRVN